MGILGRILEPFFKMPHTARRGQVEGEKGWVGKGKEGGTFHCTIFLHDRKSRIKGGKRKIFSVKGAWGA